MVNALLVLVLARLASAGLERFSSMVGTRNRTLSKMAVKANHMRAQNFLDIASLVQHHGLYGTNTILTSKLHFAHAL